jgi:hypothetical protein
MSRMGECTRHRHRAVCHVERSRDISYSLRSRGELTMVFGHPIEHVILVVEIENEMIAIR